MSEDLRPLVDAAKAGDRKALNELAGCVDRFVRIFSGNLSHHLRKTQGSTTDFVLEGLAEAMANLENFEYHTDEQFYAWISSTIRSRMVDAWRREARQKRAGRPVPIGSGSLAPAADDPSASRIVSDAELRSEVGKAIVAVQVEHPEEMEVVVAKVFDGQSWSMIRALRGLSSERRARTLFAKGIDLLRPRLKKALGPALDEILAN